MEKVTLQTEQFIDLKQTLIEALHHYFFNDAGVNVLKNPLYTVPCILNPVYRNILPKQEGEDAKQFILNAMVNNALSQSADDSDSDSSDDDDQNDAMQGEFKNYPS